MGCNEMYCLLVQTVDSLPITGVMVETKEEELA